MGLFKPRIKILGQELAGQIEAVGADVTRFNKGDKVFAATEMSLGAYAEYICLPADHAISKVPSNISLEEAAAIPVGGLNSLHFLSRADIKPGQQVLIKGAGGSIGTIAIQLAKYYGAEVTAIDSTNKLEMLRSIGADHIIDYTKEDFTKNGKFYDVIFDVAGKVKFTQSLKSLRPNGYLLIANPRLHLMIRGFFTSKFSNKKVITGVVNETPEDMDYLKELIETGKIKIVIDKRFPIEQIPEAHRYVESGQKTGNIIITLEN